MNKPPKVIIVVDMQNDFIDGALGTTEAQAMLPRLVQKLEREKDRADFIFTRDTHGADYPNTNEGKHLPVKHCIKGTTGWEISPALKKYARTIIDKPTFGAVKLPELIGDYEEIELVGLCTDICVISNALLLKAFFPEKNIGVVADCCAGVTPDSHANALAAMKMCQIEIL